MTKYAKKILEIVDASRSHLTAEQIFAQLRETYPTVVLATVYNNLNRLWEEGRVRKVSVEGMADPGTTGWYGTTTWCAGSAAGCWMWTWGI